MTLVQLEHVTKTFGKENAVTDLSFEIKKGSCTALLGPNGAGKTTTLRMLAGMIQPTSGRIKFCGIEDGDIRNHIGYLPQHPVFYNWMNALEFLVYVGELAGLTKKSAKEKSLELLKLVGLSEAYKRKIGGYSGGMKQRLGIAQAMIHEPKLVMLDEPVSALDPVGRREVIEMMRELKKKTTILFSTHVLHDAEEVCDEIVIIRKGEVALNDSLVELKRKHQHDSIKISADEELSDWLVGVKQVQGVRDVLYENQTATILVENITEARKNLLSYIAANNLPITSFQISQSSLEDLFMKVVRSE
ncbi:ABC transporter ATP-binding protein [Bacillus timonensis]|nr:ABC transporter ATP-binding protein [Bacillus timonensis]